MRRRTAIDMVSAALLIWICASCAGPTASATRRDYARGAMGGVARIVIDADDEDAATAAAAEALALIDAVETEISDYRDDSEIARIAAAAPRWTSISPRVYAVLALSTRIAAETDGAFDPTIGPLTRLWRAARDSGAGPAIAAVDSARALVDRNGLELARDASGARARLLWPGMSLDLGGIGKGFAADEALALLKSRGFPRALVELGGDFAIGDAPRGEAGWRVGRDGDASPLVLRNCGVATSGAAFRSFEANGARRSHVLNPKEGFGLEGEEATTVVAPDGATADALATALSVLPLERRSEVLRRFGARVE